MDNFGEQLASAIAESDGSLEGAMRKILNAAVQKAVNDALQSETTALLEAGGTNRRAGIAATPATAATKGPWRPPSAPITVTVPRDRNGDKQPTLQSNENIKRNNIHFNKEKLGLSETSCTL